MKIVCGILLIIVDFRSSRKSDHTLIPGHMFINFLEIFHPLCLFRTTLLIRASRVAVLPALLLITPLNNHPM